MVSNWLLLISSSTLCLAVQNASHMNQYYVGSSVLFPLNIGNFISSPAIPGLLPTNGVLQLDCCWDIKQGDVECDFLPIGGVMRGGVDTLLSGFELPAILSVV